MAQGAGVTGVGNIIVQIQGDGNSVIAGLPHLVLTRRRGHSHRILTNNDSRKPREIDVIRPFTRSIDLVGREAELEDLRAWLYEGSAVKVRVLTGPAGYGKTRLGVELVEEMAQQGWRAGFLTRGELNRFRGQQNLADWDWNAPVLAVVDYASACTSLLHDWLKELGDHPLLEPARDKSETPLRLLLLERQGKRGHGWWTQVFGRGSDAAVLEQLVDPAAPVHLKPLNDVGHRRAILTRTLERLVSDVRLPAPGTDTNFDQRLGALTWGGVPLLLMSAAATAAREGFGNVLAMNADDLAFNIVETELDRIRKVMEGQGVPAKTIPLVEHLTAVATLRQGLSAEAVVDVIKQESEKLDYGLPTGAATLRDAFAVALPDGAGGISVIEPDILGEALLLRVWGATNPDVLGAIARAHASAPVAVTKSVIRTCQDYVIRGYSRPLDWLERIRADSNDLNSLQALSDAMPEDTLALREIACTLCERTVQGWRALAGSRLDISRLGLATSLVELSNRLSALGRRERALERIVEATTLCRTAAVSQPDTFRPHLATALNNLSSRFSDLDQRDLALEAITEAVEIRRTLAADDPNAFQAELAAALNNLSNCLSDLGQWKPALEMIEEATELYRTLSTTSPGEFQPNLAASFHHLSNRLSDLDRHEQALEASKEATQLYRALVTTSPDAFQFQLANSLNSLSHRLSSVGRLEHALEASKEATELCNNLAVDYPDAFNPKLGGFLSNLSSCFANLGQLESALEASKKATKLYRDLAADEPHTFRPKLAGVLNNLSGCLTAVDHREPALEAAVEATDICRTLAKEHPDVFRPHLAGVLNNLSNCLSKLSRSEDALEAIEESVEIAHTVAAQQPGTFQPELAEFLNNLSKCLFALDRREPGLVAIQKAVKTMREPFLKLPEAFAERMRTIIRTYHTHCKSAQKQPDGVLLGPIDEAFRRLQVSPPDETAGDKL